MQLRAPLALGGDHYLTGVSVGRSPDEETVHDCAGCDGYVYRDQFHLTARVTGGVAPALYHYCSDDCLRSWLAVAAR
jgi:hypothetical protein